MSSEIGERLKQERERTGSTQADFAKFYGITARTQRNYEKGTRAPDADYLAALARDDLDVNYILSGKRWEDETATLTYVLYRLAKRLGLDLDQLDHVVDALTEDKKRRTKGDECMDPSIWERLIDELPVTADPDNQNHGDTVELNVDLLCAIIETLEARLSTTDNPMACNKKSRVIAVLYRSFKSSGKIDERMIDDAISLAT